VFVFVEFVVSKTLERKSVYWKSSMLFWVLLARKMRTSEDGANDIEKRNLDCAYERISKNDGTSPFHLFRGRELCLKWFTI
jgi:hypothetical protein